MVLVIMNDLNIYIPFETRYKMPILNIGSCFIIHSKLGCESIYLFISKTLLVYKPGVLVIVSLTSLTPLPTSKKTNYHFHEHICYFFSRMLKQCLINAIISYAVRLYLKQK